MLQQNQYRQLLEILSNESAKFADSLKRFEEVFTKNTYFNASWTIQYMIQQNVTLIIILVPYFKTEASRTLHIV